MIGVSSNRYDTFDTCKTSHTPCPSCFIAGIDDNILVLILHSGFGDKALEISVAYFLQ